MYYAALLHDIGKLSVPENILLKDQRLSDDTLEAIQCRCKSIKYALGYKKNYMPLNEAEAAMVTQIDAHFDFIKNLQVLII